MLLPLARSKPRPLIVISIDAMLEDIEGATQSK
jgi:hypothetical protein